ncbi:MAG TPA: ATP-binding protein [Thermoleophilaceae bacterium]|nr:ATP-binding protein [Thermoleophilaceae bacterium]
MARRNPPRTPTTQLRTRSRAGRLSVELPGDALAVRAARRVVERAGRGLNDEARRRLALVVTELVANAVRHSGGRAPFWIGLDIAVDGQDVRVEVTDPGGGFEPPPVPATAVRESGFGLVLVDTLSDRWGVEGGESTRVWLELRGDAA